MGDGASTCRGADRQRGRGAGRAAAQGPRVVRGAAGGGLCGGGPTRARCPENGPAGHPAPMAGAPRQERNPFPQALARGRPGWTHGTAAGSTTAGAQPLPRCPPASGPGCAACPPACGPGCAPSLPALSLPSLSPGLVLNFVKSPSASEFLRIFAASNRDNYRHSKSLLLWQYLRVSSSAAHVSKWAGWYCTTGTGKPSPGNWLPRYLTLGHPRRWCSVSS